MKVLNIHTRKINQPKEKVLALMTTLATKNDKVWPQEKWPPMRFKKGLTIGAKGGHGIIRYSVKNLQPNGTIIFEFSQPKGFHGIHKFEINSISNNTTEITHTIEMNTSGISTLQWIFVIKHLHDALVEDAFDKVENQFSTNKKRSPWNPWVIFLRKLLK